MTAAVLALLAAAALSARWNWWRPVSAGPAILMYHKVGDPPPGDRLPKLWVRTADFRRQMDWLKKRGYAVMTLRDLAAVYGRGQEPPERSAVITFDDGYRNNLTEALPVLEERGFPCVIFMVSETVGGENSWRGGGEARAEMLSAGELRELAAKGIEIGSHTRTHSNLARLTPAEAGAEVEGSRAALESLLGAPVSSFAYPYGGGAFDDAIRDLVKKAGYTCAVSVKQGKPRPGDDLFRLKRILVRGDDNMLDFALNVTRGRSRF
ncbi:MAG TPA: polysaccharide deacetylase family protein [Elusimicrobiales bacterium]|nr:polysaccharide deacetylase family protein [Elusimicrobiales bacterium]